MRNQNEYWRNLGQFLIGIGKMSEAMAPILIALGTLACLLNERPASVPYKVSGVLTQ